MTTKTRRGIPPHVRQLPLGARISWARKTAGLSHDRLVERLGRSNRGHLIKIERGDHVPRQDLRNAIADACGVSRDLLALDEDEEADPAMREAFRLFVDLMDRIGHREQVRP